VTAVRQRPPESRLDDVTDRLLRDYADLPAGAVHDAVDAVRAEFAAATVLGYLPVLVERGVRDRLGRPR
jgi:predicted RecB family endonuclease